MLPGQMTLPGCGDATQRELAERRAREGLKARKPQNPCDMGLFSDTAAQVDLVDLIAKTK